VCPDCDYEGPFEEVSDVHGDEVREIGWACPECAAVTWQSDVDFDDADDDD
jgi:hypothetical protein